VERVTVEHTTPRCTRYLQGGRSILQLVVTDSGQEVLFVRTPAGRMDQVEVTPAVRAALVLLGEELSGKHTSCPEVRTGVNYLVQVQAMEGGDDHEGQVGGVGLGR
jgi:hypothetical protein